MWVLLDMGFHGEVLSAPRPTPKLEDHLLSAVRDCLFNIFAATLHFGGRSSIRNLRTRHAVVTGTHLSHGHITTTYTNRELAKELDITPILDNTEDYSYSKKFDTTCKQNSSQQINEDNKKYTAKVDGTRKTIKGTSECVRPEWVEKRPSSLTTTWWWWRWLQWWRC